MHPRHRLPTSPGRRTRPAFGAVVLAALLAVSVLPAGTASAVAISGTTTVLEASDSTLQTHHPITLTATVTPGTPPPPDLSGSVTFHDQFGTDDLDLGVVAVVGGQAQLVVASLAVGTHTFTAEYAGDVNYEDSTSGPVVVVVTADIVEASGVGLSAGKFFPKVDGYRDTLKIKGTRLEPLARKIIIKNAAGKTVRTWAWTGKATGAYAVTWNGRTKAGKLLPAGRYTIIQRLSDGYSTKVYRNTVALSWKTLYWRTYTKTKSLSQAAWETSGSAGWAFPVPAAKVYGRLKVSVYARGSGAITIRDATCAGSTWNDSACWHVAYKLFNGSTWAWRTVARASGGKFVSKTRVVRAIAAADGLMWVRKADTVRLTLRYAVLR